MGNDAPIEAAPKITKDPLDEIQSDVDEDTFKQVYRRWLVKHILIKVVTRVTLQ